MQSQIIEGNPKVVECVTDVNGVGCGARILTSAVGILTTWVLEGKPRVGVWICPACKHRNVAHLETENA